MKYFSDISASELVDVFSTCTVIFTTQKIDGSYIEAGVASDGRFYTSRDGKHRYYSEMDWPVQAWANGFRSAHTALKIYYLDSTLVKHAIEKGIEVPPKSFEVVYTSAPNTIMDISVNKDAGNNIRYNKLISHGPGDLYDLSPIELSKVKQAFVDFNTIAVESVDGKTLSVVKHNDRWAISSTKLNKLHLQQFYGAKMAWMTQLVQIFDSLTDKWEIMTSEFRSRPKWVKQSDWKNHRSEIISLCKKMRKDELSLFENTVVQGQLNNGLAKHSYNSSSSIIEEGVVLTITTNNRTFNLKSITPGFQDANKLTHRVRHYLIGNARNPKTKSFFERTASWSVEQRIARLDLLLERYLNYYRMVVYQKDMKLNNTSHNVVYKLSENIPLHERTLVLFAEVREKVLRHGRLGISRKNYANSKRTSAADT